MNEKDYEKIGFKCGLEIHQQLDTHKLFCSCPSEVKKENFDLEVERKLHASESELGKIDRAALHEKVRNRTFIYKGHKDLTCLVEIDEEPPHPVNSQALDTCLEICILLNSKIVDVIQFMRKIVIDGSNTSGFQRTALVGIDGFIETSKGRVNIPTICLEEEAAQKISEKGDRVEYNIDRLGIPLLEIATAPDIKDPLHAKEVAEKLGAILRATGQVKRGLGTIRQDINISVEGTARVELKGFQDLRSIPKVIEKEIIRREEILGKKGKLVEEVRKVEPDFSTTFMRPMPGAERMYPETDIPCIPVTEEKIKSIKKNVSKLPEEKEEQLNNMGVNADLTKQLLKFKDLALFENLVKKMNKIEPSFIAKTLLLTKKDIKKRCGKEPEDSVIESTLLLLNEGKIQQSAVSEILSELAQGKKLTEILKKCTAIPETNLEKEIEKIISENKGAPFQALMGEAMKRFRGKADGKLIAEILRRKIKE